MFKGIERGWCYDCTGKRPSIIRKATFLVPLRFGHYDLNLDGTGIDKGVVGVCDECLSHRNDFQKKNKIAVDVNHNDLIYRSV